MTLRKSQFITLMIIASLAAVGCADSKKSKSRRQKITRAADQKQTPNAQKQNPAQAAGNEANANPEKANPEDKTKASKEADVKNALESLKAEQIQVAQIQAGTYTLTGMVSAYTNIVGTEILNAVNGNVFEHKLVSGAVTDSRIGASDLGSIVSGVMTNDQDSGRYLVLLTKFDFQNGAVVEGSSSSRLLLSRFAMDKIEDKLINQDTAVTESSVAVLLTKGETVDDKKAKLVLKVLKTQEGIRLHITVDEIVEGQKNNQKRNAYRQFFLDYKVQAATADETTQPAAANPETATPDARIEGFEHQGY